MNPTGATCRKPNHRLLKYQSLFSSKHSRSGEDVMWWKEARRKYILLWTTVFPQWKLVCRYAFWEHMTVSMAAQGNNTPYWTHQVVFPNGTHQPPPRLQSAQHHYNYVQFVFASLIWFGLMWHKVEARDLSFGQLCQSLNDTISAVFLPLPLFGLSVYEKRLWWKK